MKAEKISDVLDMLDEDLVAEADRLRRRRETRGTFRGKAGSTVPGKTGGEIRSAFPEKTGGKIRSAFPEKLGREIRSAFPEKLEGEIWKEVPEKSRGEIQEIFQEKTGRESREEFRGQAEIGKRRKKRGKRWTKWGMLAASVCLLLWGAVYMLLRFDYLKMGCSAQPGTIADGVYYYHVSHDGVYAYRPGGTSEKLLSAFWEDGWQVNDYGLYYVRGKSLYVRPHGSKKSIKLYTEKKSTHIGFSLQPDGNVMVTAYHKRKELIWQDLLDGKTGEMLETVMEPTPYEIYYKLGKYSDLNFVVGDRKVQLVSEQEPSGSDFSGNASGFRLFENGESILPEDIRLYRGDGRYFYTGDTLVLSGYRRTEAGAVESEQEHSSEYHGEDEEREELLILLRPDGNDSILAVQRGFYYYSGGTAFYLFYPYLDGVWCHSLVDGSHWALETIGESAVDFYEVQTDGNYLYSCAPWDHIQECWRVEYDSTGRPVKLTLVEPDITVKGR